MLLWYLIYCWRRDELRLHVKFVIAIGILGRKEVPRKTISSISGEFVDFWRLDFSVALALLACGTRFA